MLFSSVDGTGTNIAAASASYSFTADIGWLQKDGRGSIEMCWFAKASCCFNPLICKNKGQDAREIWVPQHWWICRVQLQLPYWCIIRVILLIGYHGWIFLRYWDWKEFCICSFYDNIKKKIARIYVSFIMGEFLGFKGKNFCSDFKSCWLIMLMRLFSDEFHSWF